MNWRLQNFGPRFRFALCNPRRVAASLFRELTPADERFLASITAVPSSRTRSFDDAAWNPAFPEFSAEVRATRSRILCGVGFLQKNFS